MPTNIRLPKFYPILDPEVAARHGVDPIRATEQILEGGAKILQFRHKGIFTREVFAQVSRVAELCRDAKAQFVVNDRADLAALLGAALHLGQDDLPASAALKILGLETVIGFSTHNETQIRAAAGEPVHYLALGPLFGTHSKLNPDPVVGLDELRRLRPLTDRPLVAIGGITRANTRSVLAAGADAIAIIGDLFTSNYPGETGRVERDKPGFLRARVEHWLAVTSDLQNV